MVRADSNGNGFLSVDELEEWIVAKTKEHFEEARLQNSDVFRALDVNHDSALLLLC